MASGGVSPAPEPVNTGDVIMTSHGDTMTTDGEVAKSNGNLIMTNGSINGNHSTTTSDQIKVCVFMGASPGSSPAHMAAARSLAQAMANRDIGLVYGGGTVGLMGELAKTLVSLKGPQAVHGIIPLPLVKYERSDQSEDASQNQGIAGVPKYDTYGRTTVVKDMHTRKQMMTSEVLSGAKGSGFIALSGGYGTMEELMEVVTWNQLGIHQQGIVLYNVNGFWDGIISWVKNSVEAGFISEGNGHIIKSATTAEGALQELLDYEPSAGRFKLEWGNVSQT
ncbi:lysine decarboxylase-like protein [Phlyctema vagabunda]|uniref:Lysine decarboxylase-like protein n=1 Tax=Phlyctema vagabunda TaxID=108571 RepID=A0ABR4PUQ1_9HELO